MFHGVTSQKMRWNSNWTALYNTYYFPFGYQTRLVPWNTALGPRMGSNPVEGSIPPRCGYLQLKFAPSGEWNNSCLHCCPERCIVIVYFIFHLLRRCRQSYGPSCSSYYPCWQYYCSYLNLIHSFFCPPRRSHRHCAPIPPITHCFKGTV